MRTHRRHSPRRLALDPSRDVRPSDLGRERVGPRRELARVLPLSRRPDFACRTNRRRTRHLSDAGGHMMRWQLRLGFSLAVLLAAVWAGLDWQVLGLLAFG